VRRQKGDDGGCFAAALAAGAWRDDNVPLWAIEAGQPDLSHRRLREAFAMPAGAPCEPIKLAALPKGRFLVLDGHHRVTASVIISVLCVAAGGLWLLLAPLRVGARVVKI
jgi:hypothetical protein